MPTQSILHLSRIIILLLTEITLVSVYKYHSFHKYSQRGVGTWAVPGHMHRGVTGVAPCARTTASTCTVREDDGGHQRRVCALGGVGCCGRWLILCVVTMAGCLASERREEETRETERVGGRGAAQNIDNPRRPRL